MYSGRLETQAVPDPELDLYSQLESSGAIQQQKLAIDNPIYAPSYETVVVDNDYEKLDHFRDSPNDNTETKF